MTCPLGWQQGPYKDKMYGMIMRSRCPACGQIGKRPDENGYREHP
jgi:hypothetical protein